MHGGKGGEEGKDENIQIVNVPACGRCCRPGRSLTSWLVHCCMSRPPLSSLHHDLAPVLLVTVMRKKGTDRVKRRHWVSKPARHTYSQLPFAICPRKKP